MYSKTQQKKKMQQIDKNVKLVNKLIKFCIKHFNDYEHDFKVY